MSDALYGPAERYVSRQRLAHARTEYAGSSKVLGRCAARERFFVFADTVATRRFRRRRRATAGSACDSRPGRRAEPSEIDLHAHLLRREPMRQQEALGVLGVNLVHGAFFPRRARGTDRLADGRARHASASRSTWSNSPAPRSPDVDNRLMSLQLVERRAHRSRDLHRRPAKSSSRQRCSTKADPGRTGHFRPVTQARPRHP